MIGATLRNTANPTMLGAGYKVNVIPGQATAHVDGRFLPGYEEEFLADLDRLLGPRVKREYVHADKALETDLRRRAGRRDAGGAAGRGPDRAGRAVHALRAAPTPSPSTTSASAASASRRCSCRRSWTSRACSTASTSGCRSTGCSSACGCSTGSSTTADRLRAAIVGLPVIRRAVRIRLRKSECRRYARSPITSSSLQVSAVRGWDRIANKEE